MSTTTDGDALEWPHIFVLDYMRTRSHLFWRWMSTHPSLYVTYHPYMMSGFLGADSIIRSTRNSPARQAEHDFLRQSTPSDETHEESNQTLKEDMEKAEQEVRSNLRSGDIRLKSLALGQEALHKRACHLFRKARYSA